MLVVVCTPFFFQRGRTEIKCRSNFFKQTVAVITDDLRGGERHADPLSSSFFSVLRVSIVFGGSLYVGLLPQSVEFVGFSMCGHTDVHWLRGLSVVTLTISTRLVFCVGQCHHTCVVVVCC